MHVLHFTAERVVSSIFHHLIEPLALSSRPETPSTVPVFGILENTDNSDNYIRSTQNHTKDTQLEKPHVVLCWKPQFSAGENLSVNLNWMLPKIGRPISSTMKLLFQVQ